MGEGSAEEGSLNPAHMAGRTDLPPLTVGDTLTDLAMADWGGGALTLRAPSGRYLTVAGDGFVRAAAEQPGGWVVQETFTLEAHRDGHLLRHTGTGDYVCVAAGGLKVAPCAGPPCTTAGRGRGPAGRGQGPAGRSGGSGTGRRIRGRGR